MCDSTGPMCRVATPVLSHWPLSTEAGRDWVAPVPDCGKGILLCGLVEEILSWVPGPPELRALEHSVP